MEMEWGNRQRQTLQESAIRESERVENAGDLNAELGVSLYTNPSSGRALRAVRVVATALYQAGAKTMR